MKVLYDHQTFVYQNFGGISRYFVELAQNLNRHNLAQTSFSCLFSDNFYLKNSTLANPHSILNGKFPGRMTVYNKIDRWRSRGNISKADYDIFHPTYYDDYFLGNKLNKPFVVTVHDMIHELYPGLWPNQNDIVLQKKRVINEASGIIAISENTKKDLLTIYPELQPEKIRVIHHGHSFAISNSDDKGDFRKPYLLYVGMREHYKNFDTLLESLSEVFQIHKNHTLVCAGGGTFNESEMKKIQALNLEGKVVSISINGDAHLANLYQHADSFLYPSLYEGFGIPILEAFASSCPVVISNSSCFPEVAANAAEYFDGNNVADMVQVLINLISNNGRKNELRELGLKRLKLFSWKKTARETAEFYHEIIKNASN